MGFKRATAITGFPIGCFLNTNTGAEVTTGTPTCTRLLDGAGGSCANSAAYDATAGIWKINLTTADTDGAIVGLKFALTGCLPITKEFPTDTKLTSELHDLDSTQTQAAAAAALTAYDPPTNAELEARTIVSADYATADQAAASLLVSQAILLEADGANTAASALPSAADIWSNGTRTLTAGGLSASDVWSYAGRTLSSMADVTLAATQPNYAPAKAGDVTSAIAGLALEATVQDVGLSIDDLPSLTDIESAIMDGDQVAGKSLANALRYIGAAVAGVRTGAGTASETFSDFAGEEAVSGSVDVSGNRTAVEYSDP